MKNQKTSKYNYCKESTPDSMAAAIGTKLIHARNENLKQILMNFEGNNHKLELVKIIRGVKFVDDAAATNSHAVWYALESVDDLTLVVWITNMDDIDTINDALLEAIDKKVKAVVIQGDYNSEMFDFLSGIGKEISYAANLEDAVRTAFYTCEAGEEVLYSPGIPCQKECASYEIRGVMFQEAISQL